MKEWSRHLIVNLHVGRRYTRRYMLEALIDVLFDFDKRCFNLKSKCPLFTRFTIVSLIWIGRPFWLWSTVPRFNLDIFWMMMILVSVALITFFMWQTKSFKQSPAGGSFKKTEGCSNYILDSLNSSSFTFWSSKFASSSRRNWTGIWTCDSNGSWTDKHSSHFSTVLCKTHNKQILTFWWNYAEILLN